MRSRLLIMLVYCATVMDAAPVSAQELSGIRYEVAARLDIPYASDATWSPDGTRLAITAYPTIQIWDTERWELLQKIPDAPGFSNEWNPTGDLIAGVYGGRDENVVIWDAATGEVVRQMVRTPSPDARGMLVLHDLSWHPEGRQIATDSSLTHNDVLLIWDLEADDYPQSLVTFRDNTFSERWMNIAELDWSQDGRWFLTDGYDAKYPARSIIRIWDARTGEIVRTIFPGFAPIWGPNDEQFAGVSVVKDAYVVNVWDTETGEVLSGLVVQDLIFAMSWHFETNIIAGIVHQDHLMIWDVDTEMRYDLEDIKTLGGRSVEWQPNGNQLAIANSEIGVLILNFEFGV